MGSDKPAVTAPSAPRRRWLGWVVRLFFLAAGVALVWAAYHWHVEGLTAAAEYLNVSQPPRKADYVLVLGGGEDTRPFKAAQLVTAGLAGQVLMTKVKQHPEAADGVLPTEDELVRGALHKWGVGDENILLLPEPVCASTRDEAHALATFLDQHPQATVIVVTNTFHTRRARGIFTDVLGERAGRLQFVAAPTDGYHAGNWWHFEAGVVTYSNEYCKLLIYLLGG